MAGNKSLLNTNFTDTIKMTLTTDGRLGVGKLSPHFHNKIEATGMIQGRSINPANLFGQPTGSGIQVTDGVANEYLYTGLSTWNSDVALVLGHTMNFGTNAGAIQVIGGNISYDGKITSSTPYRLALQPGGGYVSIHHAAPTYPLDVRSEPSFPVGSFKGIYTDKIIRADLDFTTGTDTPGWVYHSISNFEVKCELNGNFNNCTIDNIGNANLWERPHIMYKIIGRTAFVNFYFRISATGWGPNGGGIYVLLPPALQTIKNIHITTPAPQPQAWGDSVGFHDGSPLQRNFTFRIQPRKYTTGAFPNQWLMVLEHTYYGGTNVSSSGGVSDNVGGWRGSFTIELA